MAILENCEVHFLRANPKFPNAKYDKENPTWEVQLRTTDVAQMKQWDELGIPVKAIIPKENPTKPYWRAMLKKHITKKDGTAASPVEVINGKREAVDPDSVGNGSVGNVRIFQYPYPKKGGGQGVASVFMGLQLTKHMVYKRPPRDSGFGETETETIDPGTPEEGQDDGGADDSAVDDSGKY